MQTNNSNRIVQRSISKFDIKIPKFAEIEDFNDFVDEMTSDEDVSDEIYLKYHNQYEQREKDYKTRIFAQNDKNDKKKEKKSTNKADATNLTESSDSTLKIRINLDLSPTNFEYS